MVCNYLLSGILVFCVAGTVAHEAIVGGETAEAEEFPYQASIMINGHHGCGGAIVSDELVITAANCVIGPMGNVGGRPIFIYAGTNDLFNRTSRTAVTVQVMQIFIPSRFGPGVRNSPGDIAVLKVNQTLKIRKNTDLYRLTLPINQNITYRGQTAKIAGYGWSWVHVYGNRQIGGRNDSRLRYVETKVLSYRECQQEHPALNITEIYLCAKVKQYHHNQPRGVCIGDGGSPLVFEGTLIGIFSFGPHGCNEVRTSAVYTRVSSFLRLIRNVKEGLVTNNMRQLDVFAH